METDTENNQKNYKDVSQNEFVTEVVEASKKLLIVVDFWAPWCGPCKAIAPVIQEIAIEYSGKVKVGKVDVDQNNQIAMQYGIRSIPTLLILKDGKVIDQIVGAVPKKSITDLLDKVL